ncbi:hypothetical protein KIN20_035932 [Parelaphostrongylus tenuis]|uniref:Uncharacterized protein n=1 Tax=Parelaphostrongylus tenuis TaxID=148309 RepID=A0AAD5RCF1_PARTN|nr:hypothetical protein KIN20_035932 [Parelaphostrongylus tenuis]
MAHQAIHPSGVGKLVLDWPQTCLGAYAALTPYSDKPPRVFVKARLFCELTVVFSCSSAGIPSKSQETAICQMLQVYRQYSLTN